jgi:hypothetical protein
MMNGPFPMADVARRSFHLVVHDETPTDAVRINRGEVCRPSDGTLNV